MGDTSISPNGKYPLYTTGAGEYFLHRRGAGTPRNVTDGPFALPSRVL